PVELLGVADLVQSVQIGDEVVPLASILQVDELLDRPEVVPEMRPSGRLHSAQDPHDCSHAGNSVTASLRGSPLSRIERANRQRIHGTTRRYGHPAEAA